MMPDRIASRAGEITIDDRLVMHDDDVLRLMAKAFALPPIEPEPDAPPPAPDREATPHVVPRPTGTSRRAVSPTERRVREAIAEYGRRPCGDCGAPVARELLRPIRGAYRCPKCFERERAMVEAEAGAEGRQRAYRAGVALSVRALAYMERVAAQNCPNIVP